MQEKRTCRKCVAGGYACHRCPDLGGEVMPACMGTAATAWTPTDLTHCTCERPSRRTEIERLQDAVAKLTKRVEELERRAVTLPSPIGLAQPAPARLLRR